jgi:hypothetical protein
MKLQKNK